MIIELDCSHPDSCVLLHGLGLYIRWAGVPVCSYLRIAGLVQPGFEQYVKLEEIKENKEREGDV